jgi:GGDEF domain-containing protein
MKIIKISQNERLDPFGCSVTPLDVPQSTKPYKLSLSTGIAFADPEKPFSFDSMLSEADQNMYFQKQRKKELKGNHR